MSRENFFPNLFQDYNPELNSHLIENNKPSSRCKFVAGLTGKWQTTVARLKFLNNNDYSVYTGTSGVALLKLKKCTGSEADLQEIKQLLSLNKLKNKRHSFLCGDAGPLAIGAVVNYELGISMEMAQCIQVLKSMEDQVFDTNSQLPNEYLYGRVGFLFAVLFVNRNIPTKPFDDNFIRKVIETIFLCGKNEAKAGNFKCPLMYQWHDSYYLGAAHGVSGILYLLLQAKEYLTEAELHQLVKPTIDYLSSLRFPSGNFPSSLGRDTDNKVQWCHGAPGFVFLYCMAHKVFGDSKYLQLAVECGEVVWKRGLLRKGYSLCHGVAGNGYCFLELYQTIQDEKYLYRAIKFAEWCFDYDKTHEEHTPDRPLSLFEGVSGPMYYLLDIQDPMEAKFPGFTL